jgi:hypothetical protein
MKGRKRFEASLRTRENDVRFQMNARGFGLLARGVLFYAPHSVVLFARYLLFRSDYDDEYSRRLSSSLEFCADALLSGKLTLANQIAVATAATNCGASPAQLPKEQDTRNADHGVTLRDWLIDRLLEDIRAPKNLARWTEELVYFRVFCVDFAVFSVLGPIHPAKAPILDSFYSSITGAMEELNAMPKDREKNLIDRLEEYGAVARALPSRKGNALFSLGAHFSRHCGPHADDPLISLYAAHMFAQTLLHVEEYLKSIPRSQA